MEMPGRAYIALMLGIMTMVLVNAPAVAQTRTAIDDWIGKNDLGGVGLIQTRSARMAPDGTFEIGYARARPYKRYFLTLQALPWLEGTFRYTEVENRLFSQFESFSGQQTFKDRGADLSFRLLEENKYLPALSLTLQDGLGTGQFSSEYLTASKRYYDFDFSGGIAWGYSTSGSTLKNPLAELSPVFASRVGGARTGGQFNIGSYFSGAHIAPFGGVAYRTPIDGLTFKWEYDPNDYQNEPQGNFFQKSSPFNYGLQYRPFPWMETSLSFQRGNLTTFRMSLRSNIHDKGMPKFDPLPVPLKARAEIDNSIFSPSSSKKTQTAQTINDPKPDRLRIKENETTSSEGNGEIGTSVIVDYLFDSLESENLRLENLSFNHSEAEIFVSRIKESAVLSARVAQTVLHAMPTPVSNLTFILTRAGHEIKKTVFTRDEIERTLLVDDLFDSLEEQGVTIKDIDFSDRKATLRIVDENRLTNQNYSTIARLVADAAPITLDEITVVNIRAEVEVARSIVRRLTDDSGAAIRWVPSGVTSGTTAAKTQARPVWSNVQKQTIGKRLFKALEAEKFLADAMILEGHSVTIYGTPRRFRQMARNIGRVMRVVANHMPSEVEEMTVVAISVGMEMNRVTIRRQDLERALSYQGSVEEIWANSQIDGGTAGIMLPDGITRNWRRYPYFVWSIAPRVRSHVGGPDQFILYQFWASVGATLNVWRGLSVSGQVGRDIYNNFDKIKLESDSVLPHVRSDIAKYLKAGVNNIVRLQADYFFSPLPEWYARVSAGIFEEMYGGYGAEILHRPFNSRFAIGLDINKVRQRDFDQRFKFRNYEVVTGHINAYYQFPWYNLMGGLSVGQYLAGDKGATFRLARRFDSGVNVGVWATFTDVSAEQFGEGSFDKGFFISLPMELFLTKSTTSHGNFSFRPLFRDGGQPLGHSGRLYDITNAASYHTVFHDWKQFLD